jgi:hypothetical protein
LLLDASALIPQVLGEISGTDSIVTPHAGEYNRLFNNAPGTAKEEMVSNVRKLAKEHGITIVLKGWLNVISNGDQTATIKRSTPAITVGGTGDVLSGLAAGLLARTKPFDAALAAVYLNGVAGNLAFKRAGLHIIATDLIDSLPAAMKPFDRIASWSSRVFYPLLVTSAVEIGNRHQRFKPYRQGCNYPACKIRPSGIWLARSYDKLKALALELPAKNYVPVEFDITRPKTFEVVINNIASQGDIFGLVNNAGSVEPVAMKILAWMI